MLFDEVRRAIEGAVGNMTPARAQEIAKSMAGPGAAKEQVAKTAADLLEWSQKSRERFRDFVSHEVARQMGAMGLATQSDVDALKKRVRELERAAGMTASGRKSAAKKPAARKTVARKPAAPKAAASKATAPPAG